MEGRKISRRQALLPLSEPGAPLWLASGRREKSRKSAAAFYGNTQRRDWSFCYPEGFYLPFSTTARAEQCNAPRKERRSVKRERIREMFPVTHTPVYASRSSEVEHKSSPKRLIHDCAPRALCIESNSGGWPALRYV